jgi:diadenosine tetraphosphate (Ap4A) HIT family hydrolase
MCYFCDIKEKKEMMLLKGKYFFVVYDGFPVTKGHCTVVSNEHKASFFDLSKEEVDDLYSLILKTKELLEEKHKPDGFNIGVNEGRAAGRTVDHLHTHVIPRYFGDVSDPLGGIRWVIPDKANYRKQPSK